MARDNLKVVTELYKALRNKDTRALSALSSPDISVYQSRELPWGGVYEGVGQALQFFGKVSSFLDSNVTVERMLDAGECIAVIGRTSGTVKSTGQAFDVPLVHLWKLREQKVVSLAVYLDNPAILPQVQAEAAAIHV